MNHAKTYIGFRLNTQTKRGKDTLFSVGKLHPFFVTLYGPPDDWTSRETETKVDKESTNQQKHLRPRKQVFQLLKVLVCRGFVCLEMMSKYSTTTSNIVKSSWYRVKN